jgi:cytosine/adenosine deaminase-related metal-dependent hydrolase
MGPQGVIPHGAVYIEAGLIKVVQDTSAPAPAGFEDATRIRTGDTIYPGLIDLHNHLCYNAMPLWEVPKRYSNNGQWKNHPDYKRFITKPSQVIGRTAGVVEAMVRFVECRCLLGGVTTSQGITLANANNIRQYYKGVVRNVEQTDEPDLPEAGTCIANPSAGEAQSYLEKLKRNTCYLQHISEGTDDTARGWFCRLQMEDGEWAINKAFCGIHSTALTVEDLEIVKDRDGSMVWSPLSNYLLYGDTVDLVAAKESGILMGIGCDWAPSGSKNLLGEMKVAWLASKEQGDGTTDPVFSAEEIVSMATINAAMILKWGDHLGSIDPGKRADLVAINGQQGDDYLRIIEARETSVTLVVINGVPRVGQKRLMKFFGKGTEEIEVGASTRVLNLAQETSHPLVGQLTLAEAIQRLEVALKNLPTLAEELDLQVSSGLFGGSADAQGVSWRVSLDFEEEDPTEIDLAANPLAPHVQPLELEGITVADDPQFLRNLVAARNLPEFAKKGLPPLYGEKIPLPESAGFLRRIPEDELVPELLSTAGELRIFLRTWGELSLAERKTIVDQAIVLLQQNYVHLPLKRAMHAVDPVQQLTLLRHRLDEMQGEEPSPEIEFHTELTRTFNSLRDLHTTYRLPFPFRGKIAWLPFLIEECRDRGHRKYIVTNMVGNPGPTSFEEGVEILHWNGTPIHRVVLQNADRQAGSNPAARFARGLNSLTIRPLSSGIPPNEDWVTLRYADLDGKIQEWTQEWLVFEPGTGYAGPSPEDLLASATALGLDAHTDEIQMARKIFFGGRSVLEEARPIEGLSDYRMVENVPGGLPTYMPTVFRAMKITKQYGIFGYIRIFTFNVNSSGQFVDEFVRLIKQLPDGGLIIDVRGNGGGLIHAAECLLQVLTAKQIEPQRAQFINSPLNLQICKRHAPSPLFGSLNLRPWIRSIEQSIETGATYSLGYPITPSSKYRRLCQRYYGPVVLVTDALCYSATDIFAAGFQDHEIGYILGISENTGAGGANVWSHSLLQQLLPDSPPYAPLPKGADLRVAIRRTVRVGANAGGIVEDLGIRPNDVHQMTRQDITGHNEDLIEKATRVLLSMQARAHPLRVEFEPRGKKLPQVEVETKNVTRLDVLINGRPQRSLDVVDNSTSIDLQRIVGDHAGNKLTLELQGFEDDELVVRYREQVPQE